MADDKKHFGGQGDCKIHTERGGKSGACSNARGSGGCDYRANGGAAPYAPAESHHLVCVSSTVAYQVDASFSEDEKKKITGVYRGTAWCVNQRPNLINLPLKATYSADKDKYGGIGLPCHNWDHNCNGGYTAEVTKAMKRVWNAIKSAGTEPHFGPAEVKADLQSISDEYREVLRERGQRRGGTVIGLSVEGQKEKAWWLPFSMARTPIAAARPVSAFGQRPRWNEKFKRALTNLF